MSALYNRDILRLAVSVAHQGRLAEPHGSGDVRSPTCGSRIVADVRTAADGRIEVFAIDVQACALGQASAAILSRNVIGLDRDSLREHRRALAGLLRGDGEAGEAMLLPDSALLSPAKDHPGRHAAILLPFDATLAALDAAARPEKK